MPTWQLTMRPTPHPLRDARAWLLPGSDPEFWCDVLLRQGVDVDEVCLLLIPKSAQDRTPHCALVLWNHPDRMPATNVWPAYGQIAGRLYLPVDGQLEPMVSDAELSSLLPPGQRSYVLHPSVGLVAFEENEHLQIHQLFERRLPQVNDWTRAQVGIHTNERLWAIVTEERMPLDDRMREAGGDIGLEDPMTMDDALLDTEPSATDTERPEGDKLSAAERLWRRIQSQVRRRLRRVARQLRPQQAFYQLRELLEKNPDAGLRYAPPLRDDAPPTKSSQSHADFRLFGREIRFRVSDLNRSTWGGPSSTIPTDAFNDLRRIYHELAMRELRLGRHRRAAYILGYLLNDLHHAARVLADGGHYHEAAEIHLKLKQSQAAADCFEKGGFWQEAIDLLERIGNYQQLANLHERLGDREATRDAYRRLAERFVRADDYLAAAKIWSNNLSDQDRAIQTLEAGIAWGSLTVHDQSTQAAQLVSCFRALWKLRDERKDHEWLLRALREFRDRPTGRLTTAVLEVVGEFSQSASDEALRKCAADTTRVVASSLLRSGSTYRERVVRCIQRLDRSDLLLQRDGERYLRPSTPKKVVRPSQASIPIDHATQLSAAERWICAMSDARSFVALGLVYAQSYLCLCSVRGSWKTSSSMWHFQVYSDKRIDRLSSSLLLEPHPDNENSACLYSPSTGGLELPELPAMGDLPALSIKTPSWLPIRTVAMTTVDGHWMCVEQKSADRLVLSTWMNGKLVASRPLEHLTAHAYHALVRVHRSQVCVASGNVLEIIESSGPSLAAHYPSNIRSVIRLGTQALFVVTENAIYIDHLNSMRSEGVVRSLRILQDGLRDPMAKLIRPDTILVAHQEGVLLYGVRGETASEVASRVYAINSPCAILQTENPAQYAVLTESGTLQRIGVRP